MGNITVKFTGHGTVRKALASLYFDQNTVYDVFSSFISQKCNELQKLQRTIGLTSHDLFDAIHQMMQGQVSTWTEAQVEEKTFRALHRVPGCCHFERCTDREAKEHQASQRRYCKYVRPHESSWNRH